MTALPALQTLGRVLTAAEFQHLAEWFRNLNSAATRRAYQNALTDFMRFAGIYQADEFRDVNRAHVIAWRDDLKRRDLDSSTTRRRTRPEDSPTFKVAYSMEQKPPDLALFLKLEAQQLDLSWKSEELELRVVAELDKLYAQALSFKSTTEDNLVLFQLLTLTHYHLLFATSCQLRCHLAEAFASTRVAIDAALIAAHIVKDRSAQVAYAKRETPFDNFDRYLGNLIAAKKELPHPLMPILIGHKKTISSFASHADVYAFAHRFKLAKTEDGIYDMSGIEYFQTAENHIERRIHTLTICHMFVMVLDVFSSFLIEEVKVVPPEWRTSLTGLGAAIEKQVTVLRDHTLGLAEGKP